MPKHSNVIQFSLDQFVRFELQKLKLPEESSIAVTAKRILLSALHPDSSKELAPSADLEAITERLSVLERETGNSFLAYKEIKDSLGKIQGYEAITDRLSRLEQALGGGMERIVEMRLTLNDLISRLSEVEDALKQAPGRSRSTKRDSNGRFISKEAKNAEA